MSKVDQYNALVRENLNIFSYYVYDDDQKAMEAAQEYIQKLQQIVDRLRRIVDDGEPNEDAEDARIYRLVDVWKLPKDVLVKVMWEFLQWYGDYETGCPAKQCKDYPCYFKKEQKRELDENLANGDLDKETYNKYLNDMDFDDCGNSEGCWASYYAWCYLNGYNPMNGKKEAK